MNFDVRTKTEIVSGGVFALPNNPFLLNPEAQLRFNSIDTIGFRSITVVYINNTLTVLNGDPTNIYYPIFLQHSDDNLTFENVPQAEQLGATNYINSNTPAAQFFKSSQVRGLGYIGKKRYVRMVLDLFQVEVDGEYDAAFALVGSVGILGNGPLIPTEEVTNEF